MSYFKSSEEIEELEKLGKLKRKYLAILRKVKKQNKILENLVTREIEELVTRVFSKMEANGTSQEMGEMGEMVKIADLERILENAKKLNFKSLVEKQLTEEIEIFQNITRKLEKLKMDYYWNSPNWLIKEKEKGKRKIKIKIRVIIIRLQEVNSEYIEYIEYLENYGELLMEILENFQKGKMAFEKLKRVFREKVVDFFNVDSLDSANVVKIDNLEQIRLDMKFKKVDLEQIRLDIKSKRVLKSKRVNEAKTEDLEKTRLDEKELDEKELAAKEYIESLCKDDDLEQIWLDMEDYIEKSLEEDAYRSFCKNFLSKISVDSVKALEKSEREFWMDYFKIKKPDSTDWD